MVFAGAMSVSAEAVGEVDFSLAERGGDPALVEPLDTDGVEVNLSIDGRAQIKLTFAGEDIERPEEPAKIHVMYEIQEHIERKEWADAIAKLRPIVRSDPSDWNARMMSVSVFTQMGREAEALKILDEMIELQPKDFRTLNNAAWYYATAKDKELRDGAKAIAYARRAILERPQSYHVWSTLAESYFVNGEFEKARDAATRAFELGRAQNGSQSNMAEYRMQVWRANQALAAFSLQR